jgi:hypothetical protein
MPAWLAVALKAIQILGPLIKAWLADRLREKALEFNVAGKQTAGDEPDSAALFRAVHDDLRWWQWRRKRYLAALLEDAPPVVAGRFPLVPDRRAVVESVVCD